MAVSKIIREGNESFSLHKLSRWLSDTLYKAKTHSDSSFPLGEQTASHQGDVSPSYFQIKGRRILCFAISHFLITLTTNESVSIEYTFNCYY